MVSLQTVQRSNAQIANLPKGIVALFIGATSGIGQSTLQHLTQNLPSPRIYSVARPAAVASHSQFIDSLRRPDGSLEPNVITADVSLVSEVDRVAKIIAEKESKLDILFLSAGFMAFEGRKDTVEGLDPSMSTRYYSRMRAVQQLLPLLNNAASPRVVSVLAGGLEGPLNEQDLDLRNPKNWSFWNASVHSTTMGTLALEKMARENPRLSIIHWYPAAVATRGLERAAKFGMTPPNQRNQEEAGQYGAFLATSERYAVGGSGGSLVPVQVGLASASRSGAAGGGIYLVDPQGESTDNEERLADMRQRGVDEAVWKFTEDVFTQCIGDVKDEL